MDEATGEIRTAFGRAALVGAILLAVFDTYCRVSYWDINEFGYGVTSTPLWAGMLWLLLIAATLLTSFVAILRWQSFVALLALAWVVFQSLQGHWP